ncbi:MAG: histidine kinase, partial [Acidimicrobiia bacterium]
VVEPILGLVLIAFGLAALINVFIRIRRSDSVERQQLKWFAYSCAIFPTMMLLNVSPTGSALEGIFLVGAFVIGFNSIAFAIGIAVLRYRLYDIDVVINKTFVYFALAAFITLVYVGVVVGVGSLVGAGDEPNLGLSLAATGLVAVAFQPVRERIQRLANRVVYGQRLSPYEAVTSFSHRMAESISYEQILPSIAQAAGSAVGGDRAKVKLLFPQGGSEETYWPDQDKRTNSFDATVEVIHQGAKVGEISVAKKKGEALSPQEHKLLSDLASQAGLAFSNLRLTEELKAKLVELQESRRRIVSAQDEERRRMERDIHDGAQQQLVSMSVKLGLAKSLLAKDPTKAQQMLEELKAEASEAVETLRDLARGLYPTILEEQGLVAALKAHIDKMGLNATVEAPSLNGSRLDRSVEAAIYFVVREALQNASKHAGQSPIRVELNQTGGVISFEVKDQGPGFDPEKAKIGSGLQNMRDRIEAIGGEFRIKSSPGQGTTIKGRVPVLVMETVS